LNQLMYANHITDRQSRSLLHEVPENASTRSDSLSVCNGSAASEAFLTTQSPFSATGWCDMRAGSTWQSKAFASKRFPKRMFTS
jgi:hypothetical protein